jgi:hypothetical protein
MGVGNMTNEAKGKLYEFTCFNQSCFGTIDDVFSCGAEATQVKNVFPKAANALKNFQNLDNTINSIVKVLKTRPCVKLFNYQIDYTDEQKAAVFDNLKDTLERIVDELHNNDLWPKDPTGNGRKIW